MDSNQEIIQHRDNLTKAIMNYSNAYPTAKYSIADFRIIHSISDDDMKWLKENHPEAIDLISQKAKLNLRVRLLDPEIKASEVTAIRSYLELEEQVSTNTTHTYNIQFAKTAEDMANIIKNSGGEDNEEDV